MSVSFFLGMVCVEEVQFLAFAKEVVERGSILGHKVFEIKSVNFITLKVGEFEARTERRGKPTPRMWKRKSRASDE